VRVHDANQCAATDEIDKKTLEIRPVDGEVYSSVESLADELPDHAPRFILLSYPITLVRRSFTHAATHAQILSCD